MAKLKNYIPWYRKSFAVFGVNLTLLWQFSCFWQSFFVSHGQTMNFFGHLAVGPDLAKFRHFGKILKIFGNF